MFVRESLNSYPFDNAQTTASVARKMKVSRARIEAGVTSSGSCRLCLRTELCLTSIFTTGEASEHLRSRILDCCPITLLEDDRMPKAICSECESQVTATYEFRERCRRSERTLRSRYGSSYSNAPRRSYTPNYKIVRDCGVQTDERTDVRTRVSIDSSGEGRQGSGKEDRESRSEKFTTEDRTKIGRFEEKRENGEIGSTQSRTKSEVVDERNETGTRVNSLRSRLQQRRVVLVDRSEPGRQKSTKSRYENVQGRRSIEQARTEGVQTRTEEARDVARTTDDDREGKTGKPYLCDVCSKTFASKSGLRFHLKSHIGAKPHLCRYCGKGFAIPSYVKRHERIHGGDKRFVCHFCSAAFASSNGLKYHLRSHTGEANYRCESCGKTFRRYKYLKEHVFTHTGEKPFICKTCGSAYGNSGSLFVHEKKCKARTRVADERECSGKAARTETSTSGID